MNHGVVLSVNILCSSEPEKPVSGFPSSGAATTTGEFFRNRFKIVAYAQEHSKGIFIIGYLLGILLLFYITENNIWNNLIFYSYLREGENIPRNSFSI